LPACVSGRFRQDPDLISSPGKIASSLARGVWIDFSDVGPPIRRNKQAALVELVAGFLKPAGVPLK
jgi:hypothetical protein